jgi:hypothetical protein
MKFKSLFLGTFVAFSFNAISQTLFVPSGTSGIGSSTNSNIGIGTSSPSSKLYIAGGEIGTDGNLRFFGTTPYIYSSGYLNPLRIEAQSVILQGHGGYVGIGTTTPGARLDVNGDVRVNGTIAFNDAVANGYYPNIYVNGDNLHFQVGSSLAIMQLSSTGVKIGCENGTTGGYLNVNGKIQASEVEIKTTPCSDYVFEKNYKLMELSSLEKFVNTYKHLPDVLSANKYKENGSYNLSEMDNLLLKKVEELTLYIIEQNKRVEALEKEKESLKSK